MKSAVIHLLLFLLLPMLVWAEPVVLLERVVAGLNRPVLVTHADDGSRRLFILEQGGRILVWNGQELLPEPFLDLSDNVVCCGERGLLGLAFHPEFKENGRFFVNYTLEVQGQLRTRIAEYRVSSGNQNRAVPSEKIVLEFEQPFANHNGGMIAFGSDGNLYIATGDGGSAGDPLDNAQNLNSLLGKLLRINVDSDQYAIPVDNPFSGEAFRAEIWAYGLRNPWRFSFDRLTGALLLGDVGQSSWEEVNLVKRGQNYGWNRMEGSHCYPPGNTCDEAGLSFPVWAYRTTQQNRGVTGGYVYRGLQPTPLWGKYIFADHASGNIWSLTPSPETWGRQLLLDTDLSIVSFGEDEKGELYVVDLGGSVHRLDFAWRHVFAHFAAGPSEVGQFRSVLTLINPTDVRLDATFRVFENNGTLHSEDSIQVPALSAEQFSIADPVDFFVGWAEVVADRRFSGSVLFSLETPQGEPVRTAGIKASEPGNQFVAQVEHSFVKGIDTGLAIANPSNTETAIIEISLEDGDVTYNIALELPPNRHVSSFATEIADLGEDFSGSARIQSNVPVVLTTLLTRNGIHLASLPVGFPLR